MDIISAFFKGIIYAFSQLCPVSFSGHESLFRYTQINLTKGGYDSILPLVTYLPVIIALCYFLRKDLLSLFKVSGSLLKNIKTSKINLNTEKKDEKFLFMVIFGSVVLILTPVFQLVFKGMNSNLIITSLGFLVSAAFIVMANNVKEKSLKESNETVLNAIIVSIFKMFCIVPGISGLGGMYFAGVLNGFKREFSLKFAYIITLVWTSFAFLRGILNIIINGVNIHFGVFYYIFTFLGALGISGFSIYLFSKAQEKKKTFYFAIYNIVIALIVLVIWIRG